MHCALGLAVSMASGVRHNFGTMAKPFHAGRAGQSAILAADLAPRGFTASQTAIEGEFGYWDMFCGALSRDGDALAHRLGNPFAVVDPGVTFKAWPCCASTFGAVEAALQIAGDLDDRAIFTEETVCRPDLQSLLRRVQHRVPEDWRKGAGTWKLGYGRGEVRLRGGMSRRGATTAPRGDVANPTSDEDLNAKFLECACKSLDESRARESLGLVRSLETLDDVRRLTDVLGGNAR